MRTVTVIVAGAALLAACARSAQAPGGAAPQPSAAAAPAGVVSLAGDPAAFWNAATVYFLLTDRFANGDPANDLAAGRAHDGALLRNFEGGDLRGLLRRIEDGWFDSLGVTAIWMTPFVEQIHGAVDEGTGRTYGYHGYWTRDWTAVDPALGTLDDLRAVVRAAHRHGIRILMDAVLNHVGPVTPQDPAWPADWVRTEPQCRYTDYASTVTCTLVRTLPDVRTESDAPVELPEALVEKWRQEGRLGAERAELDAFFQRTGYPRAPRYYIIKWLTDWVRELGIDGYRVDTAKHIEEAASAALRREADHAFAEWKAAHRGEVLDTLPFYMVGEVYGYELAHGRGFSFGDRTVDYFANGYTALINFAFKRDAAAPFDSLFARYAAALHGPLAGAAVLNYVDSHDDGSPFDPGRERVLDAGTRLLLAPGGAQVYYGDETARPLRVAGARGDANLRSMMNWTDVERGGATGAVLHHWRRLGQFRRAHPAVGAGEHRMLQDEPYVFSRTLAAGGDTDRVLVALALDSGVKTIPVYSTFANGTRVVDGYSGVATTVANGRVSFDSPYRLVLLGAQPAAAAVDEREVLVYVVNNYNAPMEIYAGASGASYKMGTVDPAGRSTFVLRQALLTSGGQVTFVARALAGGPQITMPAVYVRPGNTVDVNLTTFLGNSVATVRP